MVKICQPCTMTSPSALKACVPHTGLDHTWPKIVESGSRGAGRMRAEESQTRCARPTESIELLQKRQKKANRVSRSCPCATSRPCAKKRVGGLGCDGPKMGGQANTWFSLHFNDAVAIGWEIKLIVWMEQPYLTARARLSLRSSSARAAMRWRAISDSSCTIGEFEPRQGK